MRKEGRERWREVGETHGETGRLLVACTRRCDEVLVKTWLKAYVSSVLPWSKRGVLLVVEFYFGYKRERKNAQMLRFFFLFSPLCEKRNEARTHPIPAIETHTS